jgi:hypothetical protein
MCISDRSDMYVSYIWLISDIVVFIDYIQIDILTIYFVYLVLSYVSLASDINEFIDCVSIYPYIDNAP